MALIRRQQPERGSGTSWNLANQGVPNLFQEFDQLFNQLATPGFAQSQWVQGYPIDLYETGEELVLNMAVPGIEVDDLDISIEGRELSIKGNLPHHGGEDRRYWLQGIPFGEFRRSINLPLQVDLDSVNATVQNGLLTLRMPKAAEARARRIAISNG